MFAGARESKKPDPMPGSGVQCPNWVGRKCTYFALGAFVAGVVGSVVLLEGLQAVTNPRAMHNNNARTDIRFIRNLTST